MEVVNLADARAKISKLLDEAKEKGAIIVNRRGKPVGVLLSIEEYKRLKRNQRIEFGEYNLGKIKGTLRRKEIYERYPKRSN